MKVTFSTERFACLRHLAMRVHVFSAILTSTAYAIPTDLTLLSEPMAGDRLTELKADACALYKTPDAVFTGGNVVGFSTTPTADACCSACAAAAGCQSYSYKSTSKGCTLYSTTTGTKPSTGDASGTKKAPPPPPAPLPGKPDDSPCVKWVPYDNHKAITSEDDFVTSIKTTVLGACNQNGCFCASTIGDVFPCFVSDPGTDVFGHHDYLPPSHAAGLCISQTTDGRKVFGKQQFMAGKGDHPDGFEWKLTQQGATAPSNAVTAGKVRALARSVQNVPNPGCGHGYTGWTTIDENGKLGPLQYAVASAVQNSSDFEIAICHACKVCPKVYNASFSPGPGCPNCTKPIKPPPPPPPLSTNPCIRFGHAIPVDNHVDAEIVQEEDSSITHTWTNFKFSDFSDWVNVFKPGKGTITIWENTGGTRGAQLYQLKGIPLTPGPLVVVIKVAQSQAFNASGPEPFWPPRVPDNVETIAASYVQPGGASTAKVRLFNLSPDTKVAGMTCSANGTAEIAKNVQYSLGSTWYNVPTSPSTFTALDDLTSKKLTSRLETPPAAPLGYTNMLIGLQKGSGTKVIQMIPLVDAPEGGVCKP